jgi:hypothetical protein
MHARFILVLIAGILLFPGAAGAQLTSRVSPSSINANENLQLVLESDGDGGWPDLSPLEQDFYILDRSSSRSVRSFNGRTSHKTSIRLTLKPKRSGTLTVPAITIGTASSRPHQITVLGSIPENTPAAEPFEPMPSVPTWFTPHNGGPPNTEWWSGGPGFGTPPGFGMPGWDRPVEAGGIGSVPELAPATPPPSVKASTDTNIPNYWPWITTAVILAWLLTALWLWRGKQAVQVKTDKKPEEPPLQPAKPTEDRSTALIAAIRSAYLDNDAYAAKQALLHWGSATWVDDPPTNLSRLAARCPPQVQRQILRLEEALYSPSPISWNERPVWDMLPAPNTVGQPDTPPVNGMG